MKVKMLSAEQENQLYTKPCPHNKSIPCVQYPEECCGCNPCDECQINLDARKRANTV